MFFLSKGAHVIRKPADKEQSAINGPWLRFASRRFCLLWP